ncbi:alkylhydroperoxidase, partial [Salmonella enterica]|nr:alkylhydroperoxidase [Salmonella enterica]
MTDTVVTHEGIAVPATFTQAELGWLPWLEPLPADELTDRHRAALVDPARAKSPY